MSINEAVLKGDMLELVKLLDNGADIEEQDKYGNRPIHIATKKQNLEVVKLLVLRGANIEATNGLESTPLILAIASFNIQLINYLLEEGADPNSSITQLNDGKEKYLELHKNKKYNAMYYSYQNKEIHTEVLPYLIGKLTSDYEIEIIFEKIPLHAAVKTSQYEVVELLLARGANINRKDVYGDTPIHTAIDKDDTKLVRILLEHGADITLPNTFGYNAVQHAILHKKSNSIRIFYDIGKINDEDLKNKRLDYNIPDNFIKRIKVLLNDTKDKRKYFGLTVDNLYKSYSNILSDVSAQPKSFYFPAAYLLLTYVKLWPMFLISAPTYSYKAIRYFYSMINKDKDNLIIKIEKLIDDCISAGDINSLILLLSITPASYFKFALSSLSNKKNTLFKGFLNILDLCNSKEAMLLWLEAALDKDFLLYEVFNYHRSISGYYIGSFFKAADSINIIQSIYNHTKSNEDLNEFIDIGTGNAINIFAYSNNADSICAYNVNNLGLDTLENEAKLKRLQKSFIPSKNNIDNYDLNYRIFSYKKFIESLYCINKYDNNNINSLNNDTLFHNETDKILNLPKGTSEKYWTNKNYQFKYHAHLLAIKGKKIIGINECDLEGFYQSIYLIMKMRIFIEILTKLKTSCIPSSCLPKGSEQFRGKIIISLATEIMKDKEAYGSISPEYNSSLFLHEKILNMKEYAPDFEFVYPVSGKEHGVYVNFSTIKNQNATFFVIRIDNFGYGYDKRHTFQDRKDGSVEVKPYIVGCFSYKHSSNKNINTYLTDLSNRKALQYISLEEALCIIYNDNDRYRIKALSDSGQEKKIYSNLPFFKAQTVGNCAVKNRQAGMKLSIKNRFAQEADEIYDFIREQEKHHSLIYLHANKHGN